MSFKNTIRLSNSMYPDQAQQNVGPDLVSNCLQKISADERYLQTTLGLGGKELILESSIFHAIND